MIRSVRFNQDVRKIYKEGDRFEFRPLTLLVGDQGTGKSTLIQGLFAHSKPKRSGKGDGAFQVKDPTREWFTPEIDPEKQCPVIKFDFEQDNYRIKQHIEGNFGVHLAMIFSSHGEGVREILRRVPLKKDLIILWDEPDSCLSPRTAHWLAGWLRDNAGKDGVQIIASVHNPIVISAAEEVLSLEHRRWMSPVEFLELHRTTPAPNFPKKLEKPKKSEKCLKKKKKKKKSE